MLFLSVNQCQISIHWAGCRKSQLHDSIKKMTVLFVTHSTPCMGHSKRFALVCRNGKKKASSPPASGYFNYLCTNLEDTLGTSLEKWRVISIHGSWGSCILKLLSNEIPEKIVVFPFTSWSGAPMWQGCDSRCQSGGLGQVWIHNIGGFLVLSLFLYKLHAEGINVFSIFKFHKYYSSKMITLCYLKEQ